jgi:hypothetical protein
MAELHEVVIELVVQLLHAEPNSSVRRALVHSIAPLCIFFGRETAADVLLSHIVTFLNDRDWLVRAAFFESAVAIASCVGGQCVHDYILPLMLQALSGALACDRLKWRSSVLRRFGGKRCGSRPELPDHPVRSRSCATQRCLGPVRRDGRISWPPEPLDSTKCRFLPRFDCALPVADRCLVLDVSITASLAARRHLGHYRDRNSVKRDKTGQSQCALRF